MWPIWIVTPYGVQSMPKLLLDIFLFWIQFYNSICCSEFNFTTQHSLLNSILQLNILCFFSTFHFTIQHINTRLPLSFWIQFYNSTFDVSFLLSILQFNILILNFVFHSTTRLTIHCYKLNFIVPFFDILLHKSTLLLFILLF